MPKAFWPQCALCGKTAVGGTFIEFDGGVYDRPMGTIKFSCGCDGAAVLLFCRDLFPAWEIIRKIDLGVWKVKKRSVTQQEEVCRGAAG